MSEQLELENFLANTAKEPRVTLADVLGNIKSEEYVVKETLTICILTLQNGFKVIGTSAAASPANFNEELGRDLAKKSAVGDIWPLMGYKLKEDLFRGSKPETFLDRLRAEKISLDVKRLNLKDFIDNNPKFKELNHINQSLLHDQLKYMDQYSFTLKTRIDLNS